MKDNIGSQLGLTKNFYIFLTALVALIGIIWGWYGIFGHGLIQNMYDGKAVGVLSHVIEAQAKFPVEYYFEKAEKVLLILSVILFAGAIYLYLLFTKFKLITGIIKEQIRYKDKNKPCATDALKQFFNSRRNLLTFATFFIAFFCIYSYWGHELAASKALHIDSILFQADIPQAVHDITDVNANHSSRIIRHPLYTLFVNPIGSFLRLFLSDWSAVLALNSFFGAIGAAFAFVIFGLIGLAYLNNLLLTAIFGFSMSQLFFGSAPETYSLGFVSLAFTYLLLALSVKEKKLSLLAWILAGIFSLGVTTTNFAQSLICFSFAAWLSLRENKQTEQLIPFTLIMVSLTVICTGALVFLQQIIYSKTSSVFAPQEFLFNVDQTNLGLLNSPITVIIRTFKHFFLFNIVGPSPVIYQPPHTDLPALSFDLAYKFSVTGLVAVGLWLTALMIAFWKFVTQKIYLKDSIFFPIILCLSFNIIFHLFYGAGESERPELFLYSCNYTFLMMLLVSSYATLNNKLAAGHFALLAAFIAFNNLDTMKNIVAIYV